MRARPADYPAIMALYRRGAARFPVVGAVLLGQQDGAVYADDRSLPGSAYVEHAFGFAQAFGVAAPAFDSELERYLLTEPGFGVPKVRLYTPRLPRFLESPPPRAALSWRQRLVLDGAGQDAMPSTQGFSIRVAVDADIDAIERAFGVVRRFWRSAADFVSNARAVVAWKGDEPASICYAAAVADGEAEIDVATVAEHRRLGLGKLVVAEFVRRCRQQGVVPLWDCFANNAASMELSRASGFRPKGEPYPFFTINR